MHLASGLSVGLAGVAAGYTIGIVGDAVRDHSYSYQTKCLTAISGSPRVHAAIQGLRWHDSHFNFR